MQKDRSFTLIELLVVIAIIGLLSSIVLVNMKGTREKARIAKVLEFSQSINQALGAYAVGIWRFEEEDGDTAYDSSGYGNNGTWHGSGIEGTHWTNNGTIGSAGQFNGIDDYVDCGKDSSLGGMSELTVEVWLYRTGSDTYAAAVGEAYSSILANRCFVLYTDWPYGEAIFWITDGTNSQYTNDIGYVLTANQWIHYVGVFKGGEYLKIFVNGEEVVAATATTTISQINDRVYDLWIGQYANNPFKGLLDEVSIYNQALTAAQIQKHYAEGAARKGIVLK